MSCARLTEYEAQAVAAISIEELISSQTLQLLLRVQRELVSVRSIAAKFAPPSGPSAPADFMVIARTETLIAGWGMEEALQRATAYADAGADAILIHSKAPTAAEVTEFCAPMVAPHTVGGGADYVRLDAAAGAGSGRI